MGGEPTFVSHRRSGRRGVEHRGARRGQARARRRPVSPPAQIATRRRAGAFRPGQMVSGRAAAALVAELLLAQGRRADLDAIPRCSPTSRYDYGAGRDTAQRFLALVRRALGPAPRTSCSPPTRTPSTTCGANGGCRPTSIRSIRNLDDAQERARLAQVFEHGPGTRRRLRAARRPQSARHTLADRCRGSCAIERCYLIPGDSPLGYRLPLDSLPWVKPARYPYDPSAGSRCRSFRRCPYCASIRTQLARRRARRALCSATPAPQESAALDHAHGDVRRAARRRAAMSSCRPTDQLEDYLELVAAVEGAPPRRSRSR